VAKYWDGFLSHYKYFIIVIAGAVALLTQLPTRDSSNMQAIVHTPSSLYLLTLLFLYIVGSESIAMFGSSGLFAVWCYTVKKSYLALQKESKVLLLGFLMDFILYNLNQ
jgi:hypothetical protein